MATLKPRRAGAFCKIRFNWVSPLPHYMSLSLGQMPSCASTKTI
jgi:hypothetical protein